MAWSPSFSYFFSRLIFKANRRRCVSGESFKEESFKEDGDICRDGKYASDGELEAASSEGYVDRRGSSEAPTASSSLFILFVFLIRNFLGFRLAALEKV